MRRLATIIVLACAGLLAACSSLGSSVLLGRDISGGLSTKRARISGTDSARGGEIVVKAQVPMSELEGYAAELKSITAGRGRYALDFSHYEPVPAQVQQKLVDAYKPHHEED